MTLKLRTRPLSHRLLSGLFAGAIVGALLGMGVSLRLTQVNDSLYTHFLQGQLRIHLAVIYGVIVMILGAIVGGLSSGRNREVNPTERVMLIVLAAVVFYYGRNRLSVRLWADFGSWRIPLEIVGAIAWGVVCWLLYRFVSFLERRFRGWMLWILTTATVVILAISIFQIALVPSASGAALQKPTLPAPKENVKVAVIGIDGAWWEVMDPLMAQGRLPVFQNLVSRGVRAQFQTFLPTQSPLIWTTIATGKMPSKHHITSFRVWTFPITGVVVPLTKIPGSFQELEWMMGSIIRQTPINSTFRMSDAIWNICSDAGLTVGILNWWASYPAEPVNGYVVSDHALYNKAMDVVMDEKSRGGSESVFPPNLLSELESLVVSPESIPKDSVARFIRFLSNGDWNYYASIRGYRIFDEHSKMAMFKFSYPEDITMVRAALHLLQNHPQPDLFAIYLDGMDSMQHWYLPYYFHEEHQDVFKADNVARFKDLVPEYYVYMDEVVGQFLGALDPNTIVIVVSDHGFDRGMQRPIGMYDHLKAPPGVFLIAGDNVKHGETIADASVKDITPTILYLYGLPIGRDMDGRVLTEVFEHEDAPITWVDSYDNGDRSRGRVEPSDTDKAILEKLKALGYFK